MRKIRNEVGGAIKLNVFEEVNSLSRFIAGVAVN